MAHDRKKLKIPLQSAHSTKSNELRTIFKKKFALGYFDMI
jgi:hypothetical protein